jgi:hypothetical protein
VLCLGSGSRHSTPPSGTSAPPVGRCRRGTATEAELAAALGSFRGPGVVLIDDAELLRDGGAAGELSRLVALGGDSGRAVVLGGDAESIGMGFTGRPVEAGCSQWYPARTARTSTR